MPSAAGAAEGNVTAQCSHGQWVFLPRGGFVSSLLSILRACADLCSGKRHRAEAKARSASQTRILKSPHQKPSLEALPTLPDGAPPSCNAPANKFWPFRDYAGGDRAEAAGEAQIGTRRKEHLLCEQIGKVSTVWAGPDPEQQHQGEKVQTQGRGRPHPRPAHLQHPDTAGDTAPVSHGAPFPRHGSLSCRRPAHRPGPLRLRKGSCAGGFEC
jgi:hypothetical protein